MIVPLGEGKEGMGKCGPVPTGTTVFYAMIGTPVTQVKSPQYFNRYFARHRIEAVMVAMDVPRGEVGSYFDLMREIGNFGGCIVTIPHKREVVRHVDELSRRARQLSAVNVVRAEKGRFVGDMVDGLGFLVALKFHGISMKGKRAAIIGGGGAGAAIAQAIAEAGASEIVISEIDRGRHNYLKRMLREACPQIRVSFDLKTLEGFHIAVNATPIGMDSDTRLPFPCETLSPPTLVAEVVTKPRVTPWLQEALKRGCPVQFGEEMAYGQFGLLGRHLGFDIPDPEEMICD
ncbi:MAG: shikimate dehydrogenase [Deltaproteobacteria bacterium]|nr:shikimate dehydrogenase [Deltaproteobacteria bacterium]MBW2138025.1 shikimate dehydrogenase [Deltaproteobacteria bacterium]